MKKILMMTVVGLASIIASAATVNWSASGISVAPENTDRATYMAYLFDTSAGYDTVTAAISNGDMSVLSSALGSKAVLGSGSIMGAKATSESYAQGDYVTAFAIVLNASSPADATYYLAIAEKTSAAAVSSAGTVTVGFGGQASATWSAVAVPEPTSGLLMLVGLAGLALRRRRA